MATAMLPYLGGKLTGSINLDIDLIDVLSSLTYKSSRSFPDVSPLKPNQS
jgi:hypothetical protein